MDLYIEMLIVVYYDTVITSSVMTDDIVLLFNDKSMDKHYDRKVTNVGYKNAIIISIPKMRTEFNKFHLSIVVVENL